MEGQTPDAYSLYNDDRAQSQLGGRGPNARLQIMQMLIGSSHCVGSASIEDKSARRLGSIEG